MGTALVLIVVLSPLLLALTLIQAMTGDGVLFIQERSGRGQKRFELYKFKTMNSGGNVTAVGGWMRRFSLDELPQLYNVLKGDMSLVGPRPLLPEYDRLYSIKHLRRLTVKPGLTGLVQIKGRNKLSWSDRFDLDVEYVDNLGVWLDVKILAITLLRVFDGEGTAPSEPFRGYD